MVALLPASLWQALTLIETTGDSLELLAGLLNACIISSSLLCVHAKAQPFAEMLV